MMTRGKSKRRGNLTMLVAFLTLPVAGMMALTLDGGLVMDRRRQCQTAADLAALAAATDLYSHWNSYAGADTSGSARASALNNAKANGFDNTTGNTVAVNFNPSTYQGGQWHGQTIPVGYVEVIITYTQARFFSVIWGQSGLQVQARAVARASFQAAEPGILLLDPTSKGALNITGKGGVVITGNGDVVVDSTNSSGGLVTGLGTISAAGYYFSGGYSTSGSGTFLDSATGQYDASIMHLNVPRTPDPLAALPVPTMPDVARLPNGVLASSGVNWSGNNQYGQVNGTLTLSPGTYPGGIKVTNGNLVLQPGIYYMDGGGFSVTGNGSITVSGSASLDTGSGVLLYNAPQHNSDTISLNGNGAVVIPAPTSGTYQQISIFQARSSGATISITGNGSMNINGTIYAAGAELDVTGNGGLQDGNPIDNIGAQYVTKDMKITGNGSFNIVYSNLNATAVRTIQIVE